MNSAIERLMSLRVADVMCRNVTTVSVDAAMDDAAYRLIVNDISGVPVVDQGQHCVGVLSAVDFVRRDVRGRPAGESSQNGEEHVRDYMSPSVCSIDSDATLVDAARVMCTKHVHRLPVLDHAGRAIGIVSTLDIVAAMVHAIEE